MPTAKRQNRGGRCLVTDALLTVKDVAELLAVGPDTVVHHIRAGRLHAVNVGRSSIKPRYRIPREALDVFLEARACAAPPPRPPRRPKRDGEVTEYS
jgi:excisionase family DNA binding protein